MGVPKNLILKIEILQDKLFKLLYMSYYKMTKDPI